jgi:mannose-6-phosphate isomerase-like protein (cupin superfamily)
MNDYLVRAGAGSEFPTRERLYITERLNDPAIPGLSLADARVEPGVITELHRLSVDEWYVIQQGSGLMEVGGGTPFEVSPGDTVVISAGTSQRITNSGDGDLRFQCICRPRFTPDTYEGLE